MEAQAVNWLSNAISAAPAALGAVLAWVGVRHVNEDEKRHSKASERLAELETERVIPSEVQRLEDRLSRVHDSVNQGHSEILKLLLELQSRK